MSSRTSHLCVRGFASGRVRVPTTELDEIHDEFLPQRYVGLLRRALSARLDDHRVDLVRAELELEAVQGVRQTERHLVGLRLLEAGPKVGNR